MARLTRIVIHPILWAVYPILILVASNVQTVLAWMVYRPIVVSLMLACLSFGILWLVLRNAQKAGLIITFYEVLFFSYGHVFELLQDRQRFGTFIGRTSVVTAVWLIALIIGTVFILRARRDLLSLTQALNLVGIIAVIFPTIQIMSYAIQRPPLPSGANGQNYVGLPLPSDLSGLKLQPAVIFLTSITSFWMGMGGMTL